MPDPTPLNVPGATPPVGAPAAPVQTPVSADGKTPDITQQLKALEDQVKTAMTEAQAAKQVSEDMKGALREERGKRQSAQEQLQTLQANTSPNPKPEDILKDFDPNEIENFKKVSQALGVVTKSDLQAQQALQQQQAQQSENAQIYSAFLSSNAALFGKEGEATPEQNQNFQTFSQYVREVFDLSQETILHTPGLGKKLTAALTQLKQGANAQQLRSQIQTETLAAQTNAQLLAAGAGGGSSGATAEPGTWKRATPEPIVRQQMQRSGYSPEQIEDMIARDKGIPKK